MPDQPKALGLDGCRIVESCHIEDTLENSAYINDHFLGFVISGRLSTVYKGKEMSVRKGEAVFVRKSQYLSYKKIGMAEGEPYESLLFALTNDLIREFLRMQKKDYSKKIEMPVPFFKIEPNAELRSFIKTMRAYLSGNLSFQPELARLKVLEMLFVLTDAIPEVGNYLFQFSHPERSDLVKVMENHYTTPAKVADFAYLAGRSVSSFKRDFQSVFNSSPAQWLREKRLNLARQLLLSSDKKITEICFEVGFENLSHFSRLFKEHFGYHPSLVRKRPVLQKSMS